MYSPMLAPIQLSKKINDGTIIVTYIGNQRLCTRCNEYWPHDSEFFHRRADRWDGLAPYCKACYSELRHIRENKHKEH